MQIGVSCPRGHIKHDDCRRCSTDPLRPCSLSPDILESMRLNPDDRHADPDAFSPTGLLDCHRKSALAYRGDWYVDVEDAWPMVRGTMIHALMDMADRYPGAAGVIRETEMEVPIETRYGPQRMTGKPDLVVIKSLTMGEGTMVAKVKIVDYKSKSKIGHDLTAPHPDHVRQISMYAWLVRRWLATHYTDSLAVEVDELELIYLDFQKTRRFTSAGPLTAKGKMVKRSPREYEMLDLEPIHLYPDATVDAGIRRMIEAKIAARETLPPAYDADDENYWRCRYCSVRDECETLTRRGI